MAGDRLVHRVVEDLGRQVVQRMLVGAADIHAGAAPDRFQPLQDLDVLGGVFAALLAAAEKVVHGRDRDSLADYGVRAKT